MNEHTCHGLPADWLNAWLAAIGIASLIPGCRLRWSDSPVPVAVLTVDSGIPLEEQLIQRLPTAAEFEQGPIARHLAGVTELRLNPVVEDFAARAAIARSHPWGWMLSSLHTDARWDRKEGPLVDKGPFYTPMPGAPNTMYDRMVKMLPTLNPETLRSSFAGVGHRVQQNGIGFDIGRVGSLADKTDMWIDPAVDVLAFFGLSLFPVRGDGRSTRQRGWGTRRTGVGGFRWFTWSENLDIHGIDAWLDLAYSLSRIAPSLSAGWEVVPYQQRGSNDVTRGFASKRVI